jgi:hypothetical protein
LTFFIFLGFDLDLDLPDPILDLLLLFRQLLFAIFGNLSLAARGVCLIPGKCSTYERHTGERCEEDELTRSFRFKKDESEGDGGLGREKESSGDVMRWTLWSWLTDYDLTVYVNLSNAYQVKGVAIRVWAGPTGVPRLVPWFYDHI